MPSPDPRFWRRIGQSEKILFYWLMKFSSQTGSYLLLEILVFFKSNLACCSIMYKVNMGCLPRPASIHSYQFRFLFDFGTKKIFGSKAAIFQQIFRRVSRVTSKPTFFQGQPKLLKSIYLNIKYIKCQCFSQTFVRFKNKFQWII